MNRSLRLCNCTCLLITRLGERVFGGEMRLLLGLIKVDVVVLPESFWMRRVLNGYSHSAAANFLSICVVVWRSTKVSGKDLRKYVFMPIFSFEQLYVAVSWSSSSDQCNKGHRIQEGYQFAVVLCQVIDLVFPLAYRREQCEGVVDLMTPLCFCFRTLWLLEVYGLLMLCIWIYYVYFSHCSCLWVFTFDVLDFVRVWMSG